jgi:hypothetical protein
MKPSRKPTARTAIVGRPSLDRLLDDPGLAAGAPSLLWIRELRAQERLAETRPQSCCGGGRIQTRSAVMPSAAEELAGLPPEQLAWVKERLGVERVAVRTAGGGLKTRG